MTERLFTYRDNHKDLAVEVHGDYLVIETCVNGYDIEEVYVPAFELYASLTNYYESVNDDL